MITTHDQPATVAWCLVADSLPDIEQAVAWVTTADTGAVVTFTGTVRDHAPGYTEVTAITYEAFASEAVGRLEAIAAAARAAWPQVNRIVLWHRTGVVALGEASVQVVVSTPHRVEAFALAQFCIDVIKATVPVWKYEHAGESSGWSTAGSEALSVEVAARGWFERHEPRP